MYLGLWVVEKEADEHQSHLETNQPGHDHTGDDQVGAGADDGDFKFQVQ